MVALAFTLVLSRTRFCPSLQLGDLVSCHGLGKTFCLAGYNALFWLMLLKRKKKKILLQYFHQRNWVPVSSSREFLFHHELEETFRELRTFLFNKDKPGEMVGRSCSLKPLALQPSGLLSHGLMGVI